MPIRTKVQLHTKAPRHSKVQRRDFLKISATLAAFTVWPQTKANDIRGGLKESDLVYLTPIQSNGQLSHCQAEIWFVWDGADIYVCSNTASWRTRAAKKGMTKTQMWVGDVGVWTRSDGKYKQLPSFEAEASILSDPLAHATALDLFSRKYPFGWLRWGSTFRKELKSGARTLIRYHPKF